MRLDKVEGLVLASLNDRPIIEQPLIESSLLLGLGDLPSRNRLVLGVDTTGLRDLGPDRLWGSIALVIRRSETERTTEE